MLHFLLFCYFKCWKNGDILKNKYWKDGDVLYYSVFKTNTSTHSYEVDFLLTDNNKLVPIEVKSSNINNHKSINEFKNKYKDKVSRSILFSFSDISNDDTLELKPLYLGCVLVSELK